MTIEHDVVSADGQFFNALLQANGAALDQLLSDDFILVDVMSGSIIEKALLVYTSNAFSMMLPLMTSTRIKSSDRSWSRAAPLACSSALKNCPSAETTSCSIVILLSFHIDA